MSFCRSVRVSGTPLHLCMGTAGCGATFQAEMWFPLWGQAWRQVPESPLAPPGPQGALQLLWSSGLAGMQAGRRTCCHRLPPALPSIFLLKPGNVEG